MRMLVLMAPEMALDQVFCGARWNRTIGLSIIRAGQRAGQAIGIPLDLPVRATTSHQKTARATSFGHALGTAAALADIIGPPPQHGLEGVGYSPTQRLRVVIVSAVRCALARWCSLWAKPRLRAALPSAMPVMFYAGWSSAVRRKNATEAPRR